MNTIVILPHLFGLKNSQDQIFVPLMIGATRSVCPNEDIIFLNPNPYDMNIQGVKDYSIYGRTFRDVRELRENYVHLSTNSEAFELFCIERFFILRDFMYSQGISSCICIETDVIPFSSLTSHILRFENSFPNLLSGGNCISVAKIDIKFLNSFCSGVIEFYKSKQMVQKWTKWFERRVIGGQHGGLSDMFFCKSVADGSNGFEAEKVGDLSNPVFSDGDWWAIDSFIGRKSLGQFASEFHMSGNEFNKKIIRDVYFDKLSPFSFSLSGVRVRMVSLHYQGEAKALMGLHFARFINAIKIGSEI